MADVLKKFGRYFLLDQIAQGGMAEIYRARLAATDGAGRLLVIKRIQAGYGSNPEFLQMFKSEIKVTMGFNHANIVQVYDFGEEQAQPYIAMEFVDGRNLRQFMNRFHELKKTFPVELAAHIIEQAASGLHYAHTFKDRISGEPLNIVHRDISPQNILISYEGSMKVIDFGIAKAATNSENTRAGVIKGKPSYLSPEQITGEVLDGRCDIFALGIVLWELLVGRKLFAGENDLAVLKLIESSTAHVKPPSQFNPAVPKELDYIVMKTLAKQRDKRYQTAEELQRALHRFVYSFMPEFNPADLEYYAKDLFKNEIVEDRKRVQKLNEEAEKLLLAAELVIHSTAPNRYSTDSAQSSTSTSGSPSERSAISIKTSVSGITGANDRVKTGVLEIDTSAVKLARNPTRVTRTRIKREPGRNEPMPAGARPAQNVGGGMNQGAQPKRASSAPSLPQLPKFTKNTWITIAASLVGLILFGPEVFRHFHPSPDHYSNDTPPVMNPVNPIDQPRTPANVGDPRASGKMILLRLNIAVDGKAGMTKPDDLKILVNNQEVDPGNPAIQVPLGPNEVSIDSFNFRSVHKEFVLEPEKFASQNAAYMDVVLQKIPTGYLTLHTSQRARAILIKDGRERKTLYTPFDKEPLPVGSYTIRLIHDVLGWERKINVDIKEGELTRPEDAGRDELRLQPPGSG